MKLVQLLIFLLFYSFIISGCSNYSAEYVKEFNKKHLYENDNIVCYMATDRYMKKWSETNVRYVNEAKKRGLNCEKIKNYRNKQLEKIAQETKEKTLNPVKIYTYNNCDNYPNVCTNPQICLKATRGNNWRAGIQYKPYVNEAKKRGLSCSTNNETKYSKNVKNQSKNKKYIQLKNIAKETSTKTLINNSNVCLKLQNKVLTHIDKDEYQKASSARNLMKEMGCSTNSNGTSLSLKTPSSNAVKTYSPPKKISKYSASELSCSVGPLGKYMFRDYGLYYAKAFDDNPPKGCTQTFQYCKSRAKAIAKGAKITPSEKSPSSYSADCNLSGTNRYNTSADCTITPNTNSGGFAGGLANELGKGIEKVTAMKRIYVSNFELCMSEMGYNLSER